VRPLGVDLDLADQAVSDRVYGTEIELNVHVAAAQLSPLGHQRHDVIAASVEDVDDREAPVVVRPAPCGEELVELVPPVMARLVGQPRNMLMSQTRSFATVGTSSSVTEKSSRLRLTISMFSSDIPAPTLPQVGPDGLPA
jgi:hypothetical protein